MTAIPAPVPAAAVRGGATDDVPEEVNTRVVTGFFRAESALSAALAPVFRAHGVSSAGFNVLMILDGAGGPLCPHEVSDRRLVTRGTLTGVLDSLEREGLIRRDPNPADRRSVLLSLTRAGSTRLRRVLPDLRRREAEVLAGFSGDERRLLADLVERLAPRGGGDDDCGLSPADGAEEEG